VHGVTKIRKIANERQQETKQTQTQSRERVRVRERVSATVESACERVSKNGCTRTREKASERARVKSCKGAGESVEDAASSRERERERERERTRERECVRGAVLLYYARNAHALSRARSLSIFILFFL